MAHSNAARRRDHAPASKSTPSRAPSSGTRAKAPPSSRGETITQLRTELEAETLRADAAERDVRVLKSVLNSRRDAPTVDRLTLASFLATDIRGALDDMEVEAFNIGGMAASFLEVAGPAALAHKDPDVASDREHVRAAELRLTGARTECSKHRWTALYKLRQIEKMLTEAAHDEAHRRGRAALADAGIEIAKPRAVRS